MSQENSRRRFLKQTLGTAAALPAATALFAAAASGCDSGAGGSDGPRVLPDPREGMVFPGYDTSPFSLGVASGDPTADGFILWTRLALDALNVNAPGGMDAADVPVYWEVAEDEAFERLVARGVDTAPSRYAHAVHVEVKGVAPDAWYFYRFMVGDRVSAVGRARTLPAAGDPVDSWTLAVTSCQNWRHGYYASHRHLAVEADMDLVVFLGDYIYESGFGSDDDPRMNISGPVRTLDEYRLRYAQYKTDPDLQAAHLRCPWVNIWDDHEVENNYAGEVSDSGDMDFPQRRAAAYQAYWEHMPMRGGPPVDGSLRIYRQMSVGDLAQIFLIDTRQYRTPLPCGGFGLSCEEVATGDLLGAEQTEWLADVMGSSDATWKLIANQVVFSPFPVRGSPDAPAAYNFDQWDGYPASRDKVLDIIRDNGLDNVVVLTGDVHSLAIGRVHDVPDDATTAVLATEIVAPSTTSDASYLAPFQDKVREIPWVDDFSVEFHGYTRITMSPGQAAVDFMVVDDVTVPDAAQIVFARYVIDDGIAGPRKVS